MSNRGDDDAARAGALMVTLRILHGALMGTVLIYGGIVYFLTSRPPNTFVERAAPPPAMTWIFGGAGVVLFVLSIVLRRRGAKAGLYDDVGATGAQAADASGSRHTGQNQNGGSKYLSKCLVSWILCEAVAVMGLVLSFVHWKASPFVPFGIASLVGLLYLAPKKAELEDMRKRFG